MFYFLLLLTMAVMAFAVSAPHPEALDMWTFEVYAAYFRPGLPKGTAEWEHRASLFEKRLAEAKQHNADPSVTWKMGINQFSDWTQEERRSILGYIPAANSGPRVSAPKFNSLVPTDVDWREKGVLTAIKDQGMCGSCWAFAATEAIESSASIASGKAPDILAVEQIVQCTPNPNHCGGTGKCEGATAELAYEYVGNTTGITLQSLYPYTARDGTCDYPSPNRRPVVKVTGYKQMKENDRNETIKAVASLGPVSVGVAADDWFSYSHGVFSGCNNHATLILDHGVQLVGYTTNPDNSLTWILRNSWGSRWGENGFIRLADTSKCVKDPDPASGSGCKGGPPEVTVCGPCGLFYEVSWPNAAPI
jgi:cathepsin L